MIKKLMSLLVASSLIFTGCSSINGTGSESTVWKNKDSIKIITATDLHFISPRIMDKGEAILKVTKKGDGKVTQYTPEIMDAFIAEVIKAKPDVLLITGDLTYNGEMASHEDLVQKFTEVEKNGIPVLVIPGNHDIHIPFAYSFEKEKAYYTDSVTQEEFNSMYSGFGYSEAKMKDPSSFSYVYELDDKTWLVMIDVNTVANPGTYPNKSLDWLKGVLKESEDKNIRVFSSTHQNLLTHNERFQDSYNVVNADELRTVLEDGKDLINFAGHIHVQDITDNSTGLIEIDTGSLAVADNAYGIVEIGKDNSFSYRTRTVDVSAYAAKEKLTDQNLLDFKNYSENFFKETSGNRVLRRMAENDLDIPDEEVDKMLDVYSRVNLAYFSGRPDTIKDSIKEEEGYKLWQKYGNELNTLSYIDNVISRNGSDETKLDVNLNDIHK